MSAVDWDDLEHWGQPGTNVHVSETGSDVPECPKEEM